MQKLTDAEVETLVSRLKSGDEAAARLLVESFSKRLHALAKRKLAPMRRTSYIGPEDIVQSVCKSFLRNVHYRQSSLEFEEDADLFSWLATVAIRKCMKAMRRASIFVSDPDAIDECLAGVFHRRESETSDIEHADLIDRLLSRMPSEDREVAECLLSGMPLHSIKDTLGRTHFGITTVRERLRREMARTLELPELLELPETADALGR
ncbi:MAG: sigma-70 family RNA polymerase sigma factor [Isosphaeraceae bacterium]|nr:sigma-70 family RNA polymerase sigma factor [Isosphaeraceae bacterium]